MKNIYGVELLLDMGDCDVSKFNRRDIKGYFNQLCKLIDMEPEDLYFWDDYRVPETKRQTNPKAKGTTAVQFILTSNITIHTLDLLRTVFVNIFSCKDYDTKLAKDFTVSYFRAKECESRMIERCIL